MQTVEFYETAPGNKPRGLLRILIRLVTAVGSADIPGRVSGSSRSLTDVRTLVLDEFGKGSVALETNVAGTAGAAEITAPVGSYYEAVLDEGSRPKVLWTFQVPNTPGPIWVGSCPQIVAPGALPSASALAAHEANASDPHAAAGYARLAVANVFTAAQRVPSLGVNIAPDATQASLMVVPPSAALRGQVVRANAAQVGNLMEFQDSATVPRGYFGPDARQVVNPPATVGTARIFDAQVGGASKFYVREDGVTVFGGAMLPAADALHDVGAVANRWRAAHFSGDLNTSSAVRASEAFYGPRFGALPGQGSTVFISEGLDRWSLNSAGAILPLATTYDLGGPSNIVRSGYFSQLALGSNPAPTGALRLTSGASIRGRDSVGADRRLLDWRTDDIIEIGDGGTLFLNAGLVRPGSPTLQDLGSAAAQWRDGHFSRSVHATGLVFPGTTGTVGFGLEGATDVLSTNLGFTYPSAIHLKVGVSNLLTGGWQVAPGGHLFPTADNLFDIGRSPDNLRPRNVWVAQTMTANDVKTSTVSIGTAGTWATTGSIRGENAFSIAARNNDNSANGFLMQYGVGATPAEKERVIMGNSLTVQYFDFQNEIYISGLKVLTTRRSAIANADGTLADLTTKFNSLLTSVMRPAGHGLIAA